MNPTRAPGATAADIPRVWEVDWAVPPAEGGTPWEAYDWALEMAEELDVDLSILASTYDALGRLDWAIGSSEAGRLRVQPHGYRAAGVNVHGVSRRGSWWVRGVVLAAWASDPVLAEIESQRPAAIVAVAQWPDDIAAWRQIHSPARIGQARPDTEAPYDAQAVAELDPRAAQAINAAGGWVNQAHSTLSTHEREAVAGALVALRRADVPVDGEALRAHLMAQGWNGKLIERVVQLAERVANGQTPKHRPFRL